MFAFQDKALIPIEKKISRNQSLSFEDGLTLFHSPDLLGIGYIATKVRKRKNKDKVYFINNRHINHTNICVNRCKFCAFSKDKDAKDAYLMGIDEVLKSAASYDQGKVSEFHLVGGLHPDMPFSYYTDLLSALREKFPSVHLQAFTAVEIDYFSRISGKSIKETLQALKEAGLGSMPGGGAEIFNWETRKQICPEKITGEQWLHIMKTAHQLGIKSNATMLYGHIETAEDRVDHFLRLRDLQAETGGFMSFIPLAFHPENTNLNHLNRIKSSAALDLKMLAIARLMLDNFPHIKAFWIMIGTKLAQISLAFGVDDLDGTVVEEKITHSAGAKTPQFLSKETLISIIKEAGYRPVERDTLYRTIQ